MENHFEFPPRMAHVDQMSSVQSSRSNLAETSSNLERDLEIIDLLERERSMDIQQGLQRERERMGLPLDRRRQLPSVRGLSKCDPCERLPLTSE